MIKEAVAFTASFILYLKITMQTGIIKVFYNKQEMRYV